MTKELYSLLESWHSSQNGIGRLKTSKKLVEFLEENIRVLDELEQIEALLDNTEQETVTLHRPMPCRHVCACTGLCLTWRAS